MLLTKDLIKAELAAGHIKIEPEIDEDQISTASIDLHLSNEWRVFEKQLEPIEVSENTDYKNLTREIVADQITLKPQETILGITREKIFLPGSIAGRLEGRSRFARLGLLIHISAGFVQPGVNNRQVLEITNLSPNILVLKSGVKICQLLLEKVAGEAFYQGKFQHQKI